MIILILAIIYPLCLTGISSVLRNDITSFSVFSTNGGKNFSIAGMFNNETLFSVYDGGRSISWSLQFGMNVTADISLLHITRENDYIFSGIIKNITQTLGFVAKFNSDFSNSYWTVGLFLRDNDEYFKFHDIISLNGSDNHLFCALKENGDSKKSFFGIIDDHGNITDLVSLDHIFVKNIFFISNQTYFIIGYDSSNEDFIFMNILISDSFEFSANWTKYLSRNISNFNQVLASTIFSKNNDSAILFSVKTDSGEVIVGIIDVNGNLCWERTFDKSLNLEVVDLYYDESMNDVFLTGSFNTKENTTRPIIMKLSDLGELEYAKEMGFSGETHDYVGVGIARLNNQTIFIGDVSVKEKIAHTITINYLGENDESCNYKEISIMSSLGTNSILLQQSDFLVNFTKVQNPSDVVSSPPQITVQDINSKEEFFCYSCYDVLNSDSSVCSGNGKCSSPETCSCDEHYYSSDCSITTCFGVLSNQTANITELYFVDVNTQDIACNAKGICTSHDTCECTDEYYTGSKCSDRVYPTFSNSVGTANENLGFVIFRTKVFRKSSGGQLILIGKAVKSSRGFVSLFYIDEDGKVERSFEIGIPVGMNIVSPFFFSETSDGNLMIGSCLHNGHYDHLVSLVNLTTSVLVWSNGMSSPGGFHDVVSGGCSVDKGDAMLSFGRTGGFGGLNSIAIIKTNKYGTVVWSTRIYSAINDDAYDGLELKDGSIVIASESGGGVGYGSMQFLSSDGSSVNFGRKLDNLYHVHHLFQDQETEDIYFCGSYLTKMVYGRIQTNGNKVWIRQLTATAGKEFSCNGYIGGILEIPDQTKLVIYGNTNMYSSVFVGFLFQFNKENGDIIWANTFNESKTSRTSNYGGYFEEKDSSLFLVGETDANFATMDVDALLTKVDSLDGTNCDTLNVTLEVQSKLSTYGGGWNSHAFSITAITPVILAPAAYMVVDVADVYDHYKYCECDGVSINDEGICNFKNGSCLTETHTCSCNEKYHGSDCSIYECFSKLSNDSDNVCYGHGKCVDADKCVCEAGYIYPDCSYNIYCDGIHYLNESFVCSGKGKCTSTNNCKCDIGWEGNFCTEYNCFGIPSNSSSVCNGRGNCTSSNLCVCDFPLYDQNDEECSLTTCSNILSNLSSEVCTGRGNCIDYNNCSCELNFHGDNCQDWNCFDVSTSADSSLICGGHGNCDSHDFCTCETGYNYTTIINGPCNSWYCGVYEASTNDTNICDTHGVCVGYDDCNCTEGYFGYSGFCDAHSCRGISIYSPVANTICSSSGSCILPEICVCKETLENDYYYVIGSDCEIRFGRRLLRATETTLLGYFYAKEVDLIALHGFTTLGETFPCSRLISYNNGILDGIGNCRLLNTYESTEFYGTSQLLVIDVTNVNMENLLEKIGKSGNMELTVVGKTINVGLSPSKEHSDFSRSFTLKSFTVSSEDEDGDGIYSNDPSSSQLVCKSRLLAEEKCVEIHECQKSMGDSKNHEYFSIGYVPSIDDVSFNYAKFYWNSKDECESGSFNSVKHFKVFSAVTCTGSSRFSDSFIMYERCNSEISAILFDGGVLTYFFATTSPMYLCVFFISAFFCFCCCFNCILYKCRKYCGLIFKKKKKKINHQEELLEGEKKENIEIDDDEKQLIQDKELDYVDLDCDSSSDNSSDIYIKNQQQLEEEEEEVKKKPNIQLINNEETKIDDLDSNDTSTSTTSEEEELEEGGEEKEKQLQQEEKEEEGEEIKTPKEILNIEEEENNETTTKKIESLFLEMKNEIISKNVDDDDDDDDHNDKYKQIKESTISDFLEWIEQEKSKIKIVEDDDFIIKEEEEEKIPLKLKRNNPIKRILSIFCCCCCCCKRSFFPFFREIFKSILILHVILIKEGFALWFSCSEFLDSSDVDLTNPNYVVLSTILTFNQYIIWLSIGIYLFVLVLFIMIYIGRFHYNPLMFCVSYGSLKEYVYYRIFKSTFLVWFISVNLYSYIIKFSYLDSHEQSKSLTNVNFWFVIIFPELLLLFNLMDVLTYNGVSSNAQKSKLKRLGICGLLKFPKINFDFQKAFKDPDVILEDFFQLIYLVKKGKDFEEKKLKKIKSDALLCSLMKSEEYGHLSWEYLSGMTMEEIFFLKDFFFPTNHKPETYWSIFHHHKVVSAKWIFSFICFPLLCLCGKL